MVKENFLQSLSESVGVVVIQVYVAGDFLGLFIITPDVVVEENGTLYLQQLDGNEFAIDETWNIALGENEGEYIFTKGDIMLELLIQ